MRELEFESVGGVWECRLAEGDVKGVVQLDLVRRGTVSVLANLPGMEPCVIDVAENPWGNGVIIEVDVPEGVMVRLRSGVEVVKGVWAGA